MKKAEWNLIWAYISADHILPYGTGLPANPSAHICSVYCIVRRYNNYAKICVTMIVLTQLCSGWTEQVFCSAATGVGVCYSRDCIQDILYPEKLTAVIISSSRKKLLYTKSGGYHHSKVGFTSFVRPWIHPSARGTRIINLNEGAPSSVDARTRTRSASVNLPDKYHYWLSKQRNSQYYKGIY